MTKGLQRAFEIEQDADGSDLEVLNVRTDEIAKMRARISNASRFDKEHGVDLHEFKKPPPGMEDEVVLMVSL